MPMTIQDASSPGLSRQAATREAPYACDVSCILHLSDLHLGAPLESQFLDDQTKGSMVAGDRRAEKHVFLETIDALDADGTLAELDAVVVSGDLTNKGGTDGFEEFAELAKRLIAHVGAENIVTVPGNHDVPKEHGPGDPERYCEFLKVTQGLGLVTPLLDGRDFDERGALTDEGRSDPHLTSGDDYVIVPLNSSHFCWGTEPLREDLVEELLTATDELEKLVRELHQHDVPRVSNGQMRALENLLREADAAFANRDRDPRVRIGVLHHQLLPVNSREEFKPFESLTNLGAVRELLASLDIDVVLHGHKHEGALYWDFVADQTAFPRAPHRMLVTAAPGRFRPREPVARLIRLGPRTAARDVEITEVRAASRRAGDVERSAPQRARLWEGMPSDADAQVVRGATSSAVYARVQSLFAGRRASEPLLYLVCEIESPGDAETVPADYPQPVGVDDVQAWMTDLVGWWRLENPRLGDGVRFNHGERIHRHWDDQAARAAKLLTVSSAQDPTTTRAVILLVDPQSEASRSEPEFPSFVLVQLQLVRDGADWRLDCTGYFRKQEMRYWWPINVAELALLQREVLERVTIGSSDTRPRPGIVRTITAHALVEDRLPAVAVPAIDRAVDQTPDDLWRMAYGLIDPERVSDGAALRRLWDRYLGELEPDEDGGAVPRMSRRGLRTILDMVRSVHADAEATKPLEELIAFYDLFRDPEGANPDPARESARTAIDALKEKLDEQLGKSA
jgi:3',5'-cyclic AMP phosphodiesterase CpdA